jgi:chemotaxis protein methyltransferase CheR
MIAGGEGSGRRSLRNLGSASAVVGLPDATFVLLRDLIVERTGVLFDDPKRGILADKLTELVTANGLTSFLDYYYLLRYDDNADVHWTALMDRLSVPETFFWRQPEQLEACAQILARAHFARRPSTPFRIWSAACCTGEEPISIAIALSEAGIPARFPVEITATDGSRDMVARAIRGVYGPRSFRQLPAELKQKYFEQVDEERWRPVEELSSRIRWGVVNLVRRDELDSYARVDVIFCRNVFIYFADDAIRSVVQAFSERMAPDGHLFLAASESLSRLDVDFELTEVGDAFAYTRPEPPLSQSKERERWPG